MGLINLREKLTKKDDNHFIKTFERNERETYTIIVIQKIHSNKIRSQIIAFVIVIPYELFKP